MKLEHVLTDNRDGVLVVTVNRSKQLNALNVETKAFLEKRPPRFGGK